MYFSKKMYDPVPEEETAIWDCSNDKCSCWMRNNFSFETNPICPICGTVMINATKMLPVVLNGGK